MAGKLSIMACVLAALVALSRAAGAPQPSPSSLASPCSELLRYEAGDKPGQRSGSLILRSRERLSGVWIRLIFDKEVEDVTVDSGEFQIKKDDDGKQVRIQNRNLVLEPNAEKIVNVTIKYEGTETPGLMEYRLNARTICPQANMNRTDIFQGDSKSDYFLRHLKPAEIDRPTGYNCGTSRANKPHPWLAAVYLTVDNEQKFICDAVLVHPQYVITAAHCVTFRNEHTPIPAAIIRVHLGRETDPKDLSASLVSDVEVHPGYTAGSLLDDVALVKLSSPVEVSDDVRPICLGEIGGNDTKIIVIAGHQQAEEKSTRQMVESKVLMSSFNGCLTAAPHLENALTYETYCFTYSADDKNCAGQSGSALVVTGSDGVSTLDGIVTVGTKLQNKPCDANSVIIVSEIDRYVSWIKRIMQE
ncbi:unnamed protein product [Phyllotreta striolata]|uniref:Peptidase S1 domain-containing protein n=1 Tax=Phyllotreta striolata TaxID=444603 RepID=A0A9N9XRC3_PHYSR|nr:unnamed protein product [Phyllotreta striolata]